MTSAPGPFSIRDLTEPSRFPNRFLRDSWVVGSWRADQWTWTGKRILSAGLRRLWRRLRHKTRARMCPLYIAGSDRAG